MRYIFLAIVFALISLSCDNSTSERNPFLGERKFSYDINLNLPQFGSLNTAGNAVYIGNDNVGIRGVIVFNQGFGNFIAWEASCPNHTPNNCSTMTIEGGVTCICSCEDYLYSLANGVLLTEIPEGQKAYSLLNYRVTANGNNLRVFN